MDTSGTIQREADPDTGVLDLADHTEIAQFMSRVFSRTHQPEAPRPPSPDLRRGVEKAATPEPVEIDVLLDKATKAIAFLSARCQILEHELAEKDERLAEHEVSAKQWMQFSSGLQAQAIADRTAIDELTERAEAAEAQVKALEAVAAEARGRSAAADARSTALHGKVIAAFGRKSPVHDVLQAISLQEAAE